MTTPVGPAHRSPRGLGGAVAGTLATPPTVLTAADAASHPGRGWAFTGPEFLRYDLSHMLGREVHGTTLGILGRIGEEVARRATDFGMTIIYHNRHRKPEAEAKLGARYVSKEDLLATADHVVLTVPLTDETRGLVGAAELANMKPMATLVNVARGPVVDTDALTEALAARRIFAAALDVTDPEPLPPGYPLLEMATVVIAPHLGSATEETRQKMAERSLENLLAGLEGKPLPFRAG